MIRRSRGGGRPLGLVAIALLVVAAPVRAQEAEEEPRLGWFDEAELSVVSTGGNSESETVSLRNTLTRVWQGAELKLAAGGLRAESTTRTRSAIGTSPTDAQLVESSVSAVAAERYFVNARYDRKISGRLYWFAGAGWERNEPAGIDQRVQLAAGVGNVWLDRKEARFRSDYGLTYTHQEDVVATPGDDAFLGLRFSWEYWRQVTSTTTYGNQLVVDENLDDTSDLRVEMVNSLAVRVSESLALKVSFEAQFDNQPSLAAVPIVTPGGLPAGSSLLVEVDGLDTQLSVALVVTF